MNIEDLKPNESLEYLSEEQLREIKGGHDAGDQFGHHANNVPAGSFWSCYAPSVGLSSDPVHPNCYIHH